MTSNPQGVCGPYDRSQPSPDGSITNSNGYNTYVSNQCWADPSCHQTITAYDPGHWSVSADEPAGNTAVKTSPNVLQQYNNWCGRTWDNLVQNGCGNRLSDTPISSLSKLTSTYAETTPHNSQTIAEYAWDMWLDNDAGFRAEIMVWVDNSNRGNGGASQDVGPVTVGGQQWTLYHYGAGEAIWSLGAPGTYAQQGSGTVDLLALLHWMQANGYAAPGATIGQITAGWEICSTGGQPETFTVSQYSISAAA